MEEDLKLCTVQFTLSELLTEEDGVRAYQGSQGFMIFFFFLKEYFHILGNIHLFLPTVNMKLRQVSLANRLEL